MVCLTHKNSDTPLAAGITTMRIVSKIISAARQGSGDAED